VERLRILLPEVPVDQIVAIVNDTQNNTLTTFVTLLLREEQRQAQGADNVVDDNQCRR
jgi:hypothetical protein